MRRFNRIASTLLGVALILGGLLAATQTLAVLIAGTGLLLDLPGWHAALTSTSFADPVVLFWSALATTAGLTLLVAELLRWRPWRVAAPGTRGRALGRAPPGPRLAPAAPARPGV